MSKSIIRSAKPYWIYLILTGKKTVEVGKDFPKSKDWNKVVEMYCSKDMRSFNRIPEKDREWMRKYLGKVACRFVCDYIYRRPANTIYLPNAQKDYLDLLKSGCLTEQEVLNYMGEQFNRDMYFWHISDLVIYDNPRELGEFYGKCKIEGWHCCTGKSPLTRPFQSWGYVED